MNRKIPRVLAAAAVAALALAGCGKGSVDTKAADATKVPGTSTLHRMCDQSTLIYVSVIPGSNDEFEAFFYGGCVWDEASRKFLPAIGAGTQARWWPGDPNADEMNQQDERQGD